MNVTCVDRVYCEVNEKRNGVEHEREKERVRREQVLLNKTRERGKGSTIFMTNRNGSLPAFLQASERSGLTTGNPLNHGTPSVAIGLIIDGKDVSCGGQREAGSLMLGRS